MNISKQRITKLVRNAVLGTAIGGGTVIALAGPAAAQDPSPSPSPSPSPQGTTSTGGTGGATTTVVTGGSLARTGENAVAPLALGGAAVGIVLAGRRLLAARA